MFSCGRTSVRIFSAIARGTIFPPSVRTTFASVQLESCASVLGLQSSGIARGRGFLSILPFNCLPMRGCAWSDARRELERPPIGMLTSDAVWCVRQGQTMSFPTCNYQGEQEWVCHSDLFLDLCRNPTAASLPQSKHFWRPDIVRDTFCLMFRGMFARKYYLNPPASETKPIVTFIQGIMFCESADAHKSLWIKFIWIRILLGVMVLNTVNYRCYFHHRERTMDQVHGITMLFALI